MCSSESGFLQASQEDLASPAEGELGAVQRHHRERWDYSAEGLEVVPSDFQLSQNRNIITLAQVTYREDVAEGGTEEGKLNQVSIENILAHRYNYISLDDEI